MMKRLLLCASLLWAHVALAGHMYVAGIGGMQSYPATGNFTTFAGCGAVDSTTYTPLNTFACAANATASSDQGVLIQFMWWDTTATLGNVQLTLHVASQAADGKTRLYKAAVACDNGAQSVANPTFGTESTTFTCTNDASTAGREVKCTSANITPNSTSNLGGANLAYTCLIAARAFTGGTMTDATAQNIVGYEIDIQ